VRQAARPAECLGQESGDRVRTLLIPPFNLGAFVASTSLLRALERADPGGHLELFTGFDLAPLARKCGLGNKVAVFCPNQPDGSLRLQVEAYLRGFDQVYCLIGAYAPGVPMTRFQEVGGNSRQEAAWQLFCRAFGFEGKAPKLEVPGVTRDGSLVAIHLGLNKPTWPLERWGEVCGRLLDSGRKLLVVAGPQEAWQVSRWLVAFSLGGHCELVINSRLDSVCERLAGCGAFVAQESGPAHLCAALGLPGVMLHNQSEADMRVWGPASDRVVAMGHVSTAEEVFGEVSALVN
jgi:ADP-heptose:LPS heptosyltransferase